MKKIIIGLFGLFIFSFSGCKKEIKDTDNKTQSVTNAKIKLEHKTNPFSTKNIVKAKKNSTNTQQRTTNTINLPEDRVWVYVKFNPEKVTGEILQQLEADDDIHIMDFPFANFELYNDEFNLDEDKANQLKDGNLYAVYKKQSTLNNLFLNTDMDVVFLDELYLPTDIETDDKDLYINALIEIGYTRAEAERWFGICLFKTPHGRVKYFDTEFNNLQPVRGMQVWALFFGIPIKTYTDDNGYYAIPWRFSLGTIMGTKAKNNRVNVKPLDTHGNIFQAVGQVIVNFIVGSVHIDGWHSSCAMRSDIDMNFSGHTQVRFWSHILNAYRLYDIYAQQDNIESAPQQMVCYANWKDPGSIGADIHNNPNIPNASTPMFGHISFGSTMIEYILNGLFGANVSLASNSPNLFNLLTGLLPDMTIGIVENSEPSFYSSRIMQRCFHEISHASQYLQVGNAWYVAMSWAEAFGGGSNQSANGNPYGLNNYPNSGYVQLAESWSEFMGTTYENRLYGSLGMKLATSTGELNANPYSRRNFYHADDLIERESFFYPDRWIPYGFYHDLMDNFNIAENWDNVSGATIEQMYYTFSPNTHDICGYASAFMTNNPNFNTPDYIDLIWHHYPILCW